jgi:para-aminobenzoate synthetase
LALSQLENIERFRMSLVSCRILIVDNYDSFTYNLYQLLYECTGVAPHVVHHDSEWAHVENLLVTCDGIVIGPGPGRPENESDFGICARLLQQDRIPVLGICLGLQGLAHIYGGSITHARQPLHGRLCRVYHDGESALLAGIPNGFKVVRYNSLVVAPHSLPACLRISAWSNISDGTCSVHDSHSEVLPFRRVDPADFEDIEVMGLEHATLPKYSVQYHPESICTQFGAALVRNFLATCNRRAESLSMPTVQPTLTVSQLPSTSNTLKPLIFEFEWRDPQLYFDALFASAKNSFWLDSSRVETNSSRFAFMGDSALFVFIAINV